MSATVIESESTAAGEPAAQLLSLFATPVARVPCPFATEVNARLRASVERRMATDVKDLAFKSETIDNLTAWEDSHADQLTAWVLKVARTSVERLRNESLYQAVGAPSAADVRIQPLRSWVSIYRSGDYHPAHFHPNTAIAAIYYLAAPDSCDLDLVDPRTNVDYFDPGITFANEGHIVRLRCRPGDLLLLPGWLRHSVPEYDGDDLRISVSWNLTYEFSSGAVLQPAGG